MNTNHIVARYLEASEKVAMEFDTPEAMKKYLKEHPGADKTNHSIKKQDKPSEGEGTETEAGKSKARYSPSSQHKMEVKHLNLKSSLKYDSEFVEELKKSKQTLESLKAAKKRVRDTCGEVEDNAEEVEEFFSAVVKNLASEKHFDPAHEKIKRGIKMAFEGLQRALGRVEQRWNKPERRDQTPIDALKVKLRKAGELNDVVGRLHAKWSVYHSVGAV